MSDLKIGDECISLSSNIGKLVFKNRLGVVTAIGYEHPDPFVYLVQFSCGTQVWCIAVPASGLLKELC